VANDVPEELSHLELQPHPEGGFYRETWRSERLTVIDYLLLGGGRSAWHRVDGADEVWNHHRGGLLALHLLAPDGRHQRIVLGADRFSAVVPTGWWQAAEAIDDRWVLVGCTVAPPFRFEVFTLAPPDLLTGHPDAEALAHLLPDRVHPIHD
jgi:hypothetical protein